MLISLTVMCLHQYTISGGIISIRNIVMIYLRGCDLGMEYDNTIYSFKCTTYDTVFSKLSGLFQRIYGGIVNHMNKRLTKGAIAKLIGWLEVQHA